MLCSDIGRAMLIAVCLGLTPVAAWASEAADTASNPDKADVTIKGLRYVSMTVSDIDDTLAFYSAAVDFPVVKRYTVDAGGFPAGLIGDPGGQVEIALVKQANLYLQLMDFDPEIKEPPVNRPLNTPGYFHICFISPSTDSSYDRFRDAGLDMISRGDGPVDIGGYGVLYAYGRDPDGAVIEMEVASQPRRDDIWVSQIAYMTPDRERIIDFYSDLIGYGPYRRTEQDNHPKINDIADIDNMALKGGWIALRNTVMEFWNFTRPAVLERDAPGKLDDMGFNYIAFEVADLDAEITRLTASGVSFVGEIANQGGWKVAYAYDPDGNIFTLQENVDAPASESIDDLLWQDPAAFR